MKIILLYYWYGQNCTDLLVGGCCSETFSDPPLAFPAGVVSRSVGVVWAGGTRGVTDSAHVAASVGWEAVIVRVVEDVSWTVVTILNLRANVIKYELTY